MHSAIAGNSDGRAYVLVLLREDGAPSPAGSDAWDAWVTGAQQQVLDRFVPGEFELVHRPDGVAALTGRINAGGVARLDQDKNVAGVGLDAMNAAYQNGIHSATAAEAMKATSFFVVTELLAPPDGSAAPTAAVAAEGGGAQASSAGCDNCIALQRNPQAQNAVNWVASIEPDAGDPLAQSETSIAASPVDPGVLIGAWVEGQMEAPQTCTFLDEEYTIVVGLSCDAGDTWAAYDFVPSLETWEA